jgi:hypothetical protein
MINWLSAIRPADPLWTDYCGLLESFEPRGFPSTADLNSLLAADVCNDQGIPVRFVPSSEIPDVNYETHIYSTAQVSTRGSNWHDVFNALVWMCFPRIKSAINAMHFQSMAESCEPGRGRKRDALTLFDECGVVVVSADSEKLHQLSSRNWTAVFAGGQENWDANYKVFVFGHALLEKHLQPYKAMTANALLLNVSEEAFSLERVALRTHLDIQIAKQLLADRSFKSSSDLSPLPLAGIPGWWVDGDQDEQFYSDPNVFRQAPENLRPSRVFTLHPGHN